MQDAVFPTYFISSSGSDVCILEENDVSSSSFVFPLVLFSDSTSICPLDSKNINQ
jgi:hypothetical protein